MAEESKIVAGVRYGLRRRCPRCGEGHLFGGFLEVKGCDVCGQDNTIYPADDAPPYLTLLVVGHFFIPFAFWSSPSPSGWTGRGRPRSG